MPRSVYATICGENYTSKTKLQAAWREKVKKYPHPTTTLGHKLVGKNANVVQPSTNDIEWFVTAAASVKSHVKFFR